MRYLVLVALSYAIRAHAGPICTVAQTYLRSARGNACFEQLMTQAKTATDRKWLMKVAQTWSPPRNLAVTYLPGGFSLRQGERELGSVQWVSADPPMIYLNGKIKTASLPKDGSRSTLVHELFTGPKAAFNFSPFSEAHAAEAGADTLEKLTALFSLGDLPSTAKEVIEHMPNYNISFPRVGTIQAWTTGLPIQCNSHGVDGMSMAFGTDALMRQTGKNPEVVFRALGNDEFSSDGVVPGKKVVVKVKRADRGFPCIDTASLEQDQQYCNPAWEKFFSNNPQAKHEFVQSRSRSPSCSDLPGSRDTCRRFWEDFKNQFRHYSLFPGTDISLCEDDACRTRRKLNLKELGELTTSEDQRKLEAETAFKKREDEVKTYVDFLKANDISSADVACLDQVCREPIDVARLSVEKISEARRLLPRPVEQSNNGLVVQRILERGATTALVLSECCRDKACREVAYKRLSLDLKGAPTPGSTK